MGKRSLSDGSKTLQIKSGHSHYWYATAITVTVHPLNHKYDLGSHPRSFDRPGCIRPAIFERKDYRVDRWNCMRLDFLDPQNACLTLVQPQVEFDLSYTDTAFVSLSTTVLFNYPFSGFAKLPLSLIISLELFSCKVGRVSLSLAPPSRLTVFPDRLHTSKAHDQHKTTPRDIRRVSSADHQYTPFVHLTASQDDLHHGFSSSTGRRAEAARTYRSSGKTVLGTTPSLPSDFSFLFE